MAEGEEAGQKLAPVDLPGLLGATLQGCLPAEEGAEATVGELQTQDVLNGKAAVGIYFGSSDTKEFTDSLAKSYSVFSEKGLQVVYVPCDGAPAEGEGEGEGEGGATPEGAPDEAAYSALLQQSPWVGLPLARPKEELLNALGLAFAGEPILAVLSIEGELWTTDGVAALGEDPEAAAYPEGPWGGTPAGPPKLSETEILVRMGNCPPEPGESGIKGIFINSKNYLALGIVDQADDDDDVPFSGMKLKPYGYLSKSACLEEVKKKGFASDYHPQQKDFEKYPLEDILLMFDPDKAFGEKLVWCTTEEAYNRENGRIMALRQEIIDEFDRQNAKEAGGGGGGEGGEDDEPEENIVVRDVPKECKEWVSESAAATHEEVKNFTVVNNRPLLQVMITRSRQQFGKSTKFSDSGENIHHCRPQKDHNFAPPKKELELGIQAVKETRTCACQTTWFRPVNKSTQYSPEHFLEKYADLGYDRVDELSVFLSTVSVGVEQALQTNETVDIFQEEFAHLGEDEGAAVAKTHSKLKEHPNFHDVTYTKDKRIEWVEWVPNSSDMVVSSCCANLPFSERLENSGKASVSTVLVWSFADSLSPHAILVSPWEVTVFKFYPSDSKYLIGGLGNGQLAVWKLSDADLGHALRDKTNNSQSARGNGLEEEKSSAIPTVAHKQISMIDESHKKAVMAIEFMPATIEIERRGKGASEKNPADAPIKYFLTVAGDGQVMIWDFQALLDAINDHDFLWRPVHRLQLQRQDNGTEMGLCHILHCHDRYDDKGNKLLTNFYASTEEGELVFGDWAARAEEDRKAEVVKKFFTTSKTFRPMLSLERSPFFPDILLGVTDWAFYLFKDGLGEHLFQSSYTSTYYTRGVWSPTRPSVIYLGLNSGGIDIWDFSDQSHKASLSDTGASVAITSMMFCTHGDIHMEQKLAVGDAQGHLHIQNVPKNLIKQAGKGELENMRKFLEREEHRVKYFQERQKELRDLKDIMEKQAQMAADAAAAETGKAVDEDKEDYAAEQAYKKLELECQEQLA
eukprot:TRINITY_DN91146_c0_g1_i1.p1 TRINITY_DN91146_c0_g1~~TRINITY_DN91146_c0_g1_i1.p1  ORF type:complete len:1026 (-),score=291.63 TRINITY_DN91146_c0_g1_i1:93-3170(-)